MEHIENNKLIAEFLGMQKTSLGWFDNEEVFNDGFSNTYETLYFHSDWNWLMKVVEKIESIEGVSFVVIQKNYCGINVTNKRTSIFKVESSSLVKEEGSIYTKQMNSKIEAVYFCVIEFIKWYNKNKTT